jgi:NiFe hydrogenase small subunit HydA
MAGMSCDGCSVSVTGATNPPVEKLLLGRVPALPKLILYHPVLSVEAGSDFIANFRRAAEGKLDAPYVIILEGSVPDEGRSGDGYWSALGAGGLEEEGDLARTVDGVRQPIRTMDWVRRLAPGAAAAVAIGTCATWGGVPAASGNVTGSMSLMDFLGREYRSAYGLPVINIPGCAPVGDNFTETVAAVLLFLQGIGPLPEFDELGRPAWLFGETVHRNCVRAGYYEEGVFAREYGDRQCLVELGCWGPVVQCNITSRGAINHMGGCMNTGGPCIGRPMHRLHDAGLSGQVRALLQGAGGRDDLEQRVAELRLLHALAARVLSAGEEPRAALGLAGHRGALQRLVPRPRGALDGGPGDALLLREAAVSRHPQAAPGDPDGRCPSLGGARFGVPAPGRRVELMPLIADADLRTYWLIGLVLVAVVVVIVVVLLVAILLGARRILAAAVRALAAVEGIQRNTDPLWDLTTTNKVAADLLAGARSIRRHAEGIAGALEATEHGRREEEAHR